MDIDNTHIVYDLLGIGVSDYINNDINVSSDEENYIDMRCQIMPCFNIFYRDRNLGTLPFKIKTVHHLVLSQNKFNSVSSLKDIPKKVRRCLYIDNNPKKFTKKEIQSLTQVKYGAIYV